MYIEESAIGMIIMLVLAIPVGCLIIAGMTWVFCTIMEYLDKRGY